MVGVQERLGALNHLESRSNDRPQQASFEVPPDHDDNEIEDQNLLSNLQSSGHKYISRSNNKGKKTKTAYNPSSQLDSSIQLGQNDEIQDLKQQMSLFLSQQQKMMESFNQFQTTILNLSNKVNQMENDFTQLKISQSQLQKSVMVDSMYGSL